MKRSKTEYFSFLMLQKAVLALLITTQVHATEPVPEARDLINAMSAAARELNYDGVFIYRRGNHMDSMRLIHKFENGIETERLISLSGRAREVIRNENGVTCIFPEDQAIMVEKSRPRKFLSGQLPEPVEKIAAYYNFIVAAEDRVAGHDAWVVNVMPRDRFRYGYQLWIDKNSKLLLKSELKTHTGNTIEQIMYAQLNVQDKIDDALLEPELVGEHFKRLEHNYDNMAGGVKDSNWSVNWAPSGFNMSEHETQTISSNKMPMDHMIYSDGLAMVSVFIEKLESNSAKAPGPSQRGGVNAFATFNNGYQVTVVGEVPLATVEQMALSVRKKTH